MICKIDNQISTVDKNLERDIGFEPMTNCLEGSDSTTELIPRIVWWTKMESNHHLSPMLLGNFIPASGNHHSLSYLITGRSTRIRTLDLSLPKRAHYLTVLHSEIFWCSHTESNCRRRVTRPVLYHLTMRAFFV